MKIFALILFILPVFSAFSQCTNFNSDVIVYNWSPKNGGVGRYVKEIIDSTSAGSYLIFIGEDEGGVWLVKGQNDDQRSSASFEYFEFSGDIWCEELFNYENDRGEAEAGNDAMEHIWKVSNEKNVNFKKLHQFFYGKWTNDNYCDVKVANEELGVSLVWRLKFESSMCWCFVEWTSHLQQIE